MDDVTTAERIAHRIGRQTKNAIAWTGAVQAVVSALGLAWALWSAWKGGGEKADTEEAEADKKRDAAIEQLRLEVQTIREDLETKYRELKADREPIKKSYEVKLYSYKLDNQRLEQENAMLRRRLDSSPGSASGGSGKTSTAAGG